MINELRESIQRRLQELDDESPGCAPPWTH